MRKVRFNRAEMQLEIDVGCGFYRVDLEQCVDSAGMLDSILQVAGKRWCTPEILHDFIRCLDEACLEIHKERTQALFCPCGRGRKVVWK